MKGWQAALILLAGTLALFWVMAGRANSIHHFQAIVENQPRENPCFNNWSPTGNINDCVLNVGPCLWDGDDTLTLNASGRGSVSDSGCQNADWNDKLWVVTASCGQNKVCRPTFTFTPDKSTATFPVPVNPPKFNRGDRIKKLCVFGPIYDNEYTGYSVVPSVPPFGFTGVDGLAVPTTVIAKVEGATKSQDVTIGARSTLGVEGCPYADEVAWISGGHWQTVRIGDASYKWVSN